MENSHNCRNGTYRVRGPQEVQIGKRTPSRQAETCSVFKRAQCQGGKYPVLMKKLQRVFHIHGISELNDAKTR